MTETTPQLAPGMMCRCSGPAVVMVHTGPDGIRPLCTDCHTAILRAGHSPDIEDSSHLHLICHKCSMPIRYRPEIARWVTVTSNNHECYGKD